MGLTQSNLVEQCPFCFMSSESSEFNSFYNRKICSRCGTLIPLKTETVETVEVIPLKSLHVVPFVESLPDTEEALNLEEIRSRFVIPYFETMDELRISTGDRFQYLDVDFKIVSTFPGFGKFVSTTRIEVLEPASCLVELESVEIIRIGAYGSDQDDVKNVNEDILLPYFSTEARHIIKEEVFVSQGIQFKVKNCHPTSGLVVESTCIYSSVDVVPDLTKVHILPIYETLPNSEKDINEERIFVNYLKPFFQGNFRCIASRQELLINGVHFFVVAAEPDVGCVTLNTRVFAHGQPLFADDVRSQQMHADQEYARHLQQQFSRNQDEIVNPFMHGRSASRQLDHITNILRLRIDALLHDIPADHPRRAIIEELQSGISSPQGLHGFQNLLQMAQQIANDDFIPEGGPRGAREHQIANLPITLFESSSAPAGNEEVITCRICLSDYEDGEEIRTLPCFHKYHNECISKWLLREAKCPICKHPIS